VPDPDDLDTKGLNIPSADLAKLLSVDTAGWLAELPLIRKHFEKFGDRLPRELAKEVDDLEKRLRSA
jgi:phosphoenolpyruvate carboxykinase (GTP)